MIVKSLFSRNNYLELPPISIQKMYLIFVGTQDRAIFSFVLFVMCLYSASMGRSSSLAIERNKKETGEATEWFEG